jgi:preprotein translocase subunit SecB
MAEKFFTLEHFYLADLSLEVPNGIDLVLNEWSPYVNVDLSSSYKKKDQDFYTVNLCITVTAKQEDIVAFIVEIDQVGIFKCQGFDEQELKHILNVNCPNILFPYARETIDSVIVKGGFPALRLAPINFEAIYVESQQSSGLSTEH